MSNYSPAPEISVFDLISESINLVLQNFPQFIKSAAWPLIAFFILNIFEATLSTDPLDQRFVLVFLLGVFPQIALINICSRIAILGSAGHVGWKMTETKSLLFFFVAIMAGGIALTLFFACMGFLVSILVPEALQMTFTVVLSCSFLVCLFLFFARLVPIIPATAIGDKFCITTIYNTTHDIAWKIAGVLFLPVLIAIILGLLLHYIFGEGNLILSSVLLLIGCTIGMISNTSIALIYRKLKPFLDQAAIEDLSTHTPE